MKFENGHLKLEGHGDLVYQCRKCGCVKSTQLAPDLFECDGCHRQFLVVSQETTRTVRPAGPTGPCADCGKPNSPENDEGIYHCGKRCINLDD